MTRPQAKRRASKAFVNIHVVHEYLDEDGVWNPRDEDPPLEGAFQVNVMGSREHYLKLAEFLRHFAERDTSNDGDYHEHFQDVMSVDRRVRLHLILRKDDVGNGLYREWLPPSSKRRAKTVPRQRVRGKGGNKKRA